MSNSFETAAQIDVSSLRAQIREVLDDVLQTGQRHIVTRHGQPVAAVVPLGDLQNLQALEQNMAQEHKRDRAAVATGDTPIDEAIDALFPDVSEAPGDLVYGPVYADEPGAQPPAQDDVALALEEAQHYIEQQGEGLEKVYLRLQQAVNVATDVTSMRAIVGALVQLQLHNVTASIRPLQKAHAEERGEQVASR